jgi:transposase
MKPYSKDLRLRVLAAVDRGVQREEVAKTFSVSVPTIKRWLKRRRETGNVEPRPIPGRPANKGAMLRQWLPQQLEANHDLTLQEHCEAFEEELGEASPRPRWDGPSPACLEEAGRSKKSPVAQERDEEARGL